MGELGTKLPSPRLQIPLDGKGRGVLSLEESRNACQGHGSAWQLLAGGGRDGGCSPLLSPSPSEERWGWGQEIQFHRSPRPPPEHRRLVGHPGPLLPGTTVQGMAQSPSCSCSAQGHALRDRSDIHPLPGSPTGRWPAQRPFLLITTIQQEHRESQRSRCPPAPGGCPEHSPPSPPGSRYPAEPSQHQGPAPASGKQLHPLPPSQQPFSGRCSPGKCPLHCPHPIWTTERGQSHVPAAPAASQGSPILPRASPPKKEDGSLERKMPAQ